MKNDERTSDEVSPMSYSQRISLPDNETGLLQLTPSVKSLNNPAWIIEDRFKVFYIFYSKQE